MAVNRDTHRRRPGRLPVHRAVGLRAVEPGHPRRRRSPAPRWATPARTGSTPRSGPRSSPCSGRGCARRRNRLGRPARGGGRPRAGAGDPGRRTGARGRGRRARWPGCSPPVAGRWMPMTWLAIADRRRSAATCSSSPASRCRRASWRTPSCDAGRRPDAGRAALGAGRRAGASPPDGHLVLDARVAGLAFAFVALLLRAPFLVVVFGAALVAALVRLLCRARDPRSRRLDGLQTRARADSRAPDPRSRRLNGLQTRARADSTGSRPALAPTRRAPDPRSRRLDGQASATSGPAGSASPADEASACSTRSSRTIPTKRPASSTQTSGSRRRPGPRVIARSAAVAIGVSSG